MRIAVIGQGGREHALIAALMSDEEGKVIFAWPGSDAIFQTAHPIPAANISELPRALTDMRIDLCIIGEEKYLEAGLADTFRKAGLTVWGPSKNAARLETDKVFAKRFMQRYNIPTAPYKTADNKAELEAVIENKPFPFVLKFSRLAAGKGVRVCRSRDDVDHFIQQVYDARIFGYGQVLVEDCLVGHEVSIICSVSDNAYHMFPPARDYKQLLDGDQGPNTGGMGAVASRELLSQDVLDKIEECIIRPTVMGLCHDKEHYLGFLYFGLILTEDGPRVLEYNCRFGDPEAQAIFPLIGGRFGQYLLQTANGTIKEPIIHFTNDWTVCVIVAAENYPQASDKNSVIAGLNNISDDSVAHAGTAKTAGGDWITNGGRILGITAKAENLNLARSKVYEELQQVSFKGMHYRSDIGDLHF